MTKYKTYNDPDDLFQLEMPVTWVEDPSLCDKEDPECDPADKLKIHGPEKPAKGKFCPCVVVTFQSIGTLSRDEFIDAVRLQYKMESVRPELHFDKRLDPNTHVIEWIFQEEPSVGWQRIQLCFTDNGNVLVLFGSSELGQCEEIFEYIFSSILVSK